MAPAASAIVCSTSGSAIRCSAASASGQIPGVTAPIEIDSTEVFDRLIERSAVPVAVDYWAPWCGPCRVVAPELEKVAARANGRFVIAKVNTDALPDLGERFNIRSIPTFAVFLAGHEVSARVDGARPAAENRGADHARGPDDLARVVTP